MATLLGTRFLAGSLTVTDNDTNGTGAGSDVLTNAAGLRDASDTTKHGFSAFDAFGVPGTDASGFCVVTAGLDSPAPAGTIQFLRVKCRARGQLAFGPGPFTAAAFFSYGGATVQIASLTAVPNPTNLQQDFATNPVTGLAWTAGDLNSLLIGFALQVTSLDPAWSSAARADLYEFSIEVWGDGTPVAIVNARFSSDIMLGSASETIQKATFGDVVDKAQASGVVEG